MITTNRAQLKRLGFEETWAGAYSRVSFFRSTTTATTEPDGVVLTLPQIPEWRVHAARRAIERWQERRRARASNQRSLRNMTHWRRRAQAWKYLR